jgi:hypothetical protein
MVTVYNCYIECIEILCIEYFVNAIISNVREILCIEYFVNAIISNVGEILRIAIINI